MKLRRRAVFTDLSRPRVGLSERDVSLRQRESLRGRVLVMATGATAFSQTQKRGRTVAGPQTHGGKTP
jgi:hypothetical protein